MERFLCLQDTKNTGSSFEVKFDVWLVSPVNNVFQNGTYSSESKSNAYNFVQERKFRRETRSIFRKIQRFETHFS